MFAFASLVPLAVLAAQAQAAPARRASLLDITKYSGDTSGRYIVTLKEGSDTASVFGALSEQRSSGALNVTHEWDASFYNGFAGMQYHSFHPLDSNNTYRRVRRCGS